MEDTESSFLKEWEDYPGNPLIEPPRPEFLLGDPATVRPQDSPDGNWHLFANTLRGIHHYASYDGLKWHRKGKMFPGWRANVYVEDGTYHLLYELFTVPQFRSHVAMRTSPDLEAWSEPVTLLEPDLPWEGSISRNNGNPCLVKGDSGYMLYYSAAVVFFKDLGFCEPRHIGLATSGSINGPYEKRGEPIISPSPDDRYRNKGAGAIKVVRCDSRSLYYGFNNGMYTDDEGRTRSAILLLSSKDGIEWEQVYEEPIVGPSGDGWKRALVYQLDVKRVEEEAWLYYNARSGWRFGRECIGLAKCRLGGQQ
jgi:hypothetical protein